MHDDSEGEQLPLVFIHGSFANAKSWRKIIDHLNGERECIAVNLPGHGGLPDPDDFQNPTFKPEFDAIRAEIEHRLDPAQAIHLIGHSYGGVVALAATMENAFPVKKLTLFETVDAAVLPVFGEHEAMNFINKFIDEYKQANNTDDKFTCSHVIDFWGGKGSFAAIPEHIQIAMATMIKNNLRHWNLCTKYNRKLEDYQKLDIPVNIVLGQNSNYAAKVISGSLNDHLMRSELYVIEQASHFMITSHANECADILQK